LQLFQLYLFISLNNSMYQFLHFGSFTAEGVKP